MDNRKPRQESGNPNTNYLIQDHARFNKGNSYSTVCLLGFTAYSCIKFEVRLSSCAGNNKQQ